jgi:[ribosomal protein S5]-alanine N-acetyltransferase
MSLLKEIHTERLILQPITPDFIHQQFKTKTKTEIIDFFNTNEAGYNQLKNMHEKGMETHHLSLFYFLLIDITHNKSIGECGFHTWNKIHQKAELFYKLYDDAYKQKGFMTESLTHVIDFGFHQLMLHRIEAKIAPSNIPSLKLLQNNGFKKEGTLREDYIVNGKNEDSDCYSLLTWEWIKLNSSSN